MYKNSSTNIFDAVTGGRYINAASRNSGSPGSQNFFQKRWNSIENALGTTGSAIYDFFRGKAEDTKSEGIKRDFETKRSDFLKKYGFNDTDDYWDQKNKTENDIFSKYGYSIDDYWDKRSDAYSKNDNNKVAQIDAERQNIIGKMSQEDADKIRYFDKLQDEYKGLTDEYAANTKKQSDEYRDYRENNYASQKINQDRGKFAGSAINTLSTAVDVTGLTANPLGNAIQGGIEGVADELEQNGLENFSGERAAQNAAIGAATGAVTGALNKGLSSSLAKRGGNLFKGGNKLTQGLNTLGSSTALGRVGSTVATGAGRGALSGAVGGATGAGLSAAMNGGDVIGSAIEGAKQGAQQGALTGGVMAGANLALSKTPGVGKFYDELNSVKSRWDQSGENFDERLTNTLTSGDSAVGEWLQGNRNSKILNRVGDSVGNRIRDVSADDISTIRSGARKFADNYGMDWEEVQNAARQDLMDRVDPKQLNNAQYQEEMAKSFSNVLKVEPEILRNFAGELSFSDELNDFIEQGGNVSQNATPTTAKGWLKQAGNRIIDDLNNKGVGLSIKSVNETGNRIQNTADQYPEDIQNLKINQWENEPISEAEVVETPKTTRPQKQTTQRQVAQTPQLDSWDRLAQDSGYSSYDDVVQRFMAANPNAKVNAGNVLTWMDNNPGDWNPNMPTTAKGWAKKAGQRIAEDISESSLGNRIRNTEDNPSTRLYNALNGEGERLPDVFEPEARNQIERQNKLQALGKQLQTSAKTQKYASLYDSLDGKTAQRAIETNAPDVLADLGVKPENYLEAAKTSNYVNGVVSDLAEKSGVKVVSPDLVQKLNSATDDVIFTTPNAEKKFNTAIRQIVADGDTPDEYSAGYLIEKSRDFGNKAAKLRGNADDVNALRTAYTNVKYILRDEATNALAKANITGEMTNDNIAKGLEKMGANQKVIDYYTAANDDGSAPNASDYIRRTSYFEQARDMGNQVAAEKFTRSASKQPTNMLTRMWRASGLEQPVNLLLSNTVAPAASLLTRGVGKTLETAGNVGAKIGGNATPTTTDTTTPTVVSTPSLTNANNPAMNVYNAIGRTEGLTNAEQARTANYLTDATKDLNAQSGYVAPLAATTSTYANTLEDLATPNTTTSSTNLYDSLYGTPTNTTTNATTTTASNQNSYFQPTGDYWTDVLARAMTSAIDADDVTAFISLYGMYQDALSNLQKQSSSTSSDQKLTATQQRANAAMNSLERISNMTPDLAYNLSSIPVIGNIATLGGNDYEAEARSLAQQIGYMVSGANIKEEEAYNIGKAYVPQPWDNEQVRQNKLRRAYEIIQQYQNGYAG